MDISIEHIGIQLVLFLLLWFVLRELYFKPLLKLIHRREELTVGKEKEASDWTDKIDALQAEYQTQIQETKDKLENERLQLMTQVQTDTKKKVSEAQLKSASELKSLTEKLSEDITNLKNDLPRVADEISKEIVKSVTTSKVVRL